ncbi:MAG: cation:proton antiporter [Aquificae bacterium]|nr:cation:proton antiporter [Aquificota bacterium]
MHGDLHNLFLDLALILFSAKIFGLLAKRFGVPEVLGEVFAGIVLGPSIFGLIPLNEAIKILAEIGIILLLFQVGLEVDFPNLIKVGWWALFVALFGALVPFLGGFFLSHYWFGLDLVGSLFIGGALTATSIGITVKVLSDLGQNNKPFAQIVLGAAVIDDILGVIFLTALYEFAKYKTLQLDATLQLSFFIVFFLLIAPIVAQIFAKALFWLIKKSKEDSAIAPFIMGLILLAAYLAQQFGTPSILGSFTAGLALSRRFIIPFVVALKLEQELLQKVEHQVRTLMWVFAPIFFVSVGLALNLREIDFSSAEFWIISLSLLAVAILGKLLAGFVVLNLPLREKIAVGLSMLPRGEVGLIFAEFGRLTGAVNETLYAVVVFVVALTTLLAPIGLKLLFREKEAT